MKRLYGSNWFWHKNSVLQALSIWFDRRPTSVHHTERPPLCAAVKQRARRAGPSAAAETCQVDWLSRHCTVYTRVCARKSTFSCEFVLLTVVRRVLRRVCGVGVGVLNSFRIFLKMWLTTASRPPSAFRTWQINGILTTTVTDTPPHLYTNPLTLTVTQIQNEPY